MRAVGRKAGRDPRTGSEEELSDDAPAETGNNVDRIILARNALELQVDDSIDDLVGDGTDDALDLDLLSMEPAIRLDGRVRPDGAGLEDSMHVKVVIRGACNQVRARRAVGWRFVRQAVGGDYQAPSRVSLAPRPAWVPPRCTVLLTFSARLDSHELAGVDGHAVGKEGPR